MATFERAGVTLSYETHGDGFPVLLFAPGGMRSTMDRWSRMPFDPAQELSRRFRVIAMDQRNAGGSQAPITASDGWHSYTADHLALLDHLGAERCHVLGSCIGGSYCLGLMQAAPGRVASGVLLQPIGLSPTNRDAFYQLFDGWAEELRRTRDDIDPSALPPFRERMYGGDFVFNVSRDFVASCRVPMLVLGGNDHYHPAEISEEIARLAPQAELIGGWKEPDATARALERVIAFLVGHTPG